MPMYAIVRVEKLKTKADIRAASNHQTRAQPVPNADPARPIHIECRGETPYDAVVRRLEKVRRPRRDNVLAAELVLSASPQYFRADPTDYGTYDQRSVRDFVDRAVAWLEERYGDNLVSVTLHLDEASPHLHAIVVPLVEGRLSARSMFFLKGKFSEIQDDFAEAMKPLGLQRGVPQTSARHQDIRDWYKTEPQRLRGLAEELDRQRDALVEKELELDRRIAAVEAFLEEPLEVDPDAAAEWARLAARTVGGSLGQKG